MVDNKAVALLGKLQTLRTRESTDCRKFNKVSFIRILTDSWSAPAGYTDTAIHLLEINTRIQVYSRTYSAYNSSYSLIPLLSGFLLTPHILSYKANIAFPFLFSWYWRHRDGGKAWVNSFSNIAYDDVYPLSNVRIIKSKRTKWEACNRRWRNKKYVQKFCWRIST